MKNVSEGGLAIKLVDSVKLEGVVVSGVRLSSVEPQTVYAKVDVVSSDCYGVGLRFLYLEKDSGVALQTWLNSLVRIYCYGPGPKSSTTNWKERFEDSTRCSAFTLKLRDPRVAAALELKNEIPQVLENGCLLQS